MTRLRWWSIYLLSFAVGYSLGAVLSLRGGFTRPLHEIVAETARHHADEAAARRGPYLAPITVVALLSMVVILIGALA